MEHSDKIELTRILATYGIRPTVDALADLIELNNMVKFYEGSYTEGEEKDTIVSNLRRELY